MDVRWLDGGITSVKGVRVGQVSDALGYTGVTAVLFDEPAFGGSDIRGGAASTRQFGSLDPMHVHGRLHACVFAGGSAFGLEAGTGVAAFLERKGVGLPVLPGLVVPVVPTAIILDVGALLSKESGRPDAAMGYAASEVANSDPVLEGSVGAGTGAAVGKCMGIRRAMKGGIGSAAVELPSGGRIGALVVVNAFGDIIDPGSGRTVAGLRRSEDSLEFASSVDTIVSRGRIRFYGEPIDTHPGDVAPQESTTLALVVTDLPLTRVELSHVARIAGHGLVRTISPCHTLLDGDVVVTAGTAGREITPEDRMEGEGGGAGCVDAMSVGVVAAEVVSRAVIRGVSLARGLPGLPGLSSH